MIIDYALGLCAGAGVTSTPLITAMTSLLNDQCQFINTVFMERVLAEYMNRQRQLKKYKSSESGRCVTSQRSVDVVRCRGCSAIEDSITFDIYPSAAQTEV